MLLVEDRHWLFLEAYPDCPGAQNCAVSRRRKSFRYHTATDRFGLTEKAQVPYRSPMLGFSRKLPVVDEERLWIDEGFRRLEKMLGRSRILEAEVILPNADCFPDPYDKTAIAAERLFRRVCDYMQVDRTRIELEIVPDETEELREIAPNWNIASARWAGQWRRDASEVSSENEGKDNPPRMLVTLRSSLLKDPLALVATVAHELGHAIMFDGEPTALEKPDHEPMTDLLTIFLGFGVFTANSAFRFKQYNEGAWQGWSTQRLGYLRQEAYGYALARFASIRGERKPDWSRYLSRNVRAYFKRSQVWLARNFDRTEER